MRMIKLACLALLFFAQAAAQNPTYNLILKNDFLVSSTVYEFDIFIEKTSVESLQIASLQPIMTFNTGISAGILSLSIVGGTSDLGANQVPNSMSVTGNELRIDPRTPPGAGSGSNIPTSPGSRVGRFRLTSTLAFTTQQAGIAWKNNTDPFTKVFAYPASDLNTDVTDSTRHLNSLIDPSLSPPSITTTSPLPNGTAGFSYLDTLFASGGTPPYAWTLAGGSLPTGITLSGAGVLTGTPGTVATSNFTARVTDDLLATTTRAFSLTIDPAQPRRLVFTQQPTNEDAGTFITPPIMVQLEDSLGNEVQTAGIAITMNLTTGDGTLSGSLIETTDASGVATFDSLWIDKTGDKTITASSSITTSTASNTFIILAVPESQVRVETASDGSGTLVPTQDVTAGSSITVYAVSRDPFDNFVANVAASTWSLQNITGGVVDGDLVPGANRRSAVFTARLTGSGEIRAEEPSLTPVNSGTLTVVAGPARKLTFSQQPTDAVAGAPISPAVTVQLRDSADNPVSLASVSVMLSLTGGSGNLTGSNPQPTNGSGLATFSDLTIETPGVKSLTASSTGLTSAVSDDFSISTYTITASAGANGAISPSGAVGVNFGANQSFTITPNFGFHVEDVLVDGGSVGAVTSHNFINVTADHTISASFAPDTIEVTIQTSPAGRLVRIDGVPYLSPQSFLWNLGSSHTIDTDSAQTETAGTRFFYAGWSDGGALSHTITPTTDSTFTASFLTQYFLTTTAGPGGTVSPPGDWRNSGEVVQISATPATGNTFSGWSGSGSGSFTGATNPVNITMNGPITETAAFTKNPITVTVTTVPLGRTITVDDVNFTSPQTFNWLATDPHTISTDSIQLIVAGTRAVWSSWTDAGPRSHTIAPTTSTTITASFITQHFLSMSANPGGTVSPASNWFNEGQQVIIQANPNPGFIFTSWTGTGTGSYSGSNNPVATSILSPITEVANFSQPTVLVTIETNPTGRTFSVDGGIQTNTYTFALNPGGSAILSTDSLQGQLPSSRYVYTSWSDGGARTHTLLYPGKDTTIRLNFKRQYFLTMNATAGGTVSPPSGWYDSAQVVGIGATPAMAYSFSGWTGSGIGSYSGPDNPGSVTMHSAVTQNGTFTLSPINVTVQSNPPGRTFRVDGTEYTGSQAFVWSATDPHTLTTDWPQGDSATRYLFSSWSDGGGQTHSVSPATDSIFTVNFSTQHFLTVDTGTAGGTVLPPNGWYNAGQLVQISASPYTGYNFGSWTGTGNGSYSGGANPVNVTMNSPIQESANFTLGTIPITVTTIPSGLSITVDGLEYTSPQLFNWATGSAHVIGTDSIQPGGTPENRYRWTGWDDPGPIVDTVSPNSARTYTATFVTQFLLTMTANPGGSVSPPTGWHDSGSVIGIAGIPNPGFSFGGWVGSGTGSLTGSANPGNVTMNGPITEIANFVQNAFQVTIQASPPGRTFSVGGTNYTTPQTFSVVPGNLIELNIPLPTQSGGAGVRYLWTDWSDGGEIMHLLTPTSDTTVTANFKTQYLLTTAAQTGGSAAPGSGWYDAGVEVPIIATPFGGYTFAGWTGSGTGSYTGSDNPSAVTMQAPISETATFTLFPIQVHIRSNPSGRTVLVDGVPFVTPQDIIWTSGTIHTLSADSVQDETGGERYVWTEWSNGGGRSMTVIGLTDTTFTVNFKSQYYLTMLPDTAAAGGIVTPPSSWHDSAAIVPISVTPSTGFGFAGWVGTGPGSYSGTLNPASVSMLGPVTEEATFSVNSVSVTVRTLPAGRPIMVDDSAYVSPAIFSWLAGSSHSILTDSLQPLVAGTRLRWTSWSDGGTREHVVAPLTDTVFTANLTTQYYLTMVNNPGGTSTPPSGWFDTGMSVNIMATPNSGFTFSSWSGSGTGSYSGELNPSTVVVGGPITQTANFDENRVLITIQTNPAGRSFRVNNTTYTSIHTFSFPPGDSITLSADSLQPGTIGVRYVWTGWSDGGARSHTFTVPGTDSTITVDFGLQYQLRTSADPPAAGTIEPASPSFHNAGDTVQLFARSAAGFAFTSWSGSVTGTANPTPLVMDGVRTVTANFSPAALVLITSTPPGRTLLIDGISIIAPDTFNWLLGSTHDIGTVSPQNGNIGTRHLWSGWSDAGEQSHSVTVDDDTSFEASFSTQYLLKVGTGDINGTAAPAEGWRDDGTPVEISGTPMPGYGFVEWAGTGPSSYSGFSNPVQITMNGWATQVASFGRVLPPPSLAGIQNGAIDQPLKPRLTWQSYPGATSYIVQVATDTMFSQLSNIVDTSGITDTTIQLPILLNFQSYYWRVKARVGSDISLFSETRMFSTLKPTLTVSSPGLNWGTTYAYDISWTVLNLTGPVNVLLSIDDGLTYRILDSNQSGNSIRWMVPLTQTPSNFCRLRVASSLKPDLFAESGNFAIVAGGLPLIVPLSASIPFPSDPTNSTSYRLVSSPGIVDTSLPLSAVVPGSHPKDWRMFADNGQPSNYLVELGPESHFETGRGYWLIKRNTLDIATEMVMPALDTINGVYRITVRSGWNIIANPFDKNLNWSSVVELNRLPTGNELYGYAGSFHLTTIMAPFRGYYFFNSIDLPELKIPYPFGSTSSTPLVAGRVVDWQIRLGYESEFNEDPSNFIGVAPAAKDGLDELDGYKPPIFLDQGFLYFKRPEWNPEYSLFNADIRHEIGEGQGWEFEVTREYGTTGAINFEGIDNVPAEYEVVLMNAYNSTPVNLRENGSYSFRSVSTTMPFKILVGPAEYVRAQITAGTPEEFELEQNFPNPFNSTTSISIKLPVDAKISLDVYSVLGQKIVTLAAGEYSAGVHTFLWEGTDQNRIPVATGVYVYRLSDGESLLRMKKMIIVK